MGEVMIGRKGRWYKVIETNDLGRNEAGELIMIDIDHKQWKVWLRPGLSRRRQGEVISVAALCDYQMEPLRA